jgi:hypothetical protein
VPFEALQFDVKPDVARESDPEGLSPYEVFKVFCKKFLVSVRLLLLLFDFII